MDLEQVFSWTPLDIRGVVMAVAALVLLGPVAVWLWWRERKKRRPLDPNDTSVGHLVQLTGCDGPHFIADRDWPGLVTEVRRLTVSGFVAAVARNWWRSAKYGALRAAVRSGFLDVANGDLYENGRWRWRFWAPRRGQVTRDAVEEPEDIQAFVRDLTSEIEREVYAELERRPEVMQAVTEVVAATVGTKVPFTDVGVDLIRNFAERSGTFVPGSVAVKEVGGGMVEVTGTMAGKIAPLPKAEVDRFTEPDGTWSLRADLAPMLEEVRALPSPPPDAPVEPLSVEWSEMAEAMIASGAVIPGSMESSVAPPRSEAEKAGRVLRATMHYTPPSIDEEKLAAFAKKYGAMPSFTVLEARRLYAAFRAEAGKLDGAPPAWERLDVVTRGAWFAVARAAMERT